MRLILPAARIALLGALASLMLTATNGCGLKGDLYLPEQHAEVESEVESDDSDSNPETRR